jgi:hypothetical protein
LQIPLNKLLPEIHEIFDTSTATNSETAPLFMQSGNELKPTAEKQIREKLKEIRNKGDQR